MKAPQIRFVFDRKNASTTSRASNPRSALVQIEIMYERRRKYIGTGVRVYKDQWSDSSVSHVRNRSDMVELNRTLDIQMRRMRDKVNAILDSGEPFSFERLEQEQQRESVIGRTFLDFMEERIAERGDIRTSTRKKHISTLKTLKDFGGIVRFGDLTASNVMRFDDYLHSKGVTQVTVHSHHKTLKTYINIALAMGYIRDTPYRGVKIERGVGRGKKYLTEDELMRLCSCPLPDRLDRVRDVFLFQCYTALSYSDMAKLDFARDAVVEDGKYKIRDTRIKTDEEYYIVLVEPAMAILKKYKYKLPVISNQKMNDALKLIALASDIDKPITTHYGRHTFCVMAFNNGISADVIARMMGHRNSTVTLQAYARLVTKTIDKGYETMEGVFSKNTER